MKGRKSLRFHGLSYHLPLVVSLLVVLLVGLLGAAFAPLVLQRTVTSMMIAVVLAVGLYIFSGNSGILSFGHMSFMAVGAYVTSWLTIPANLKALFFSFPGPLDFLYTLNVPPWAGLLAGVFIAAVVGLVTGSILMRLSDIEASIATLSLLLIVNVVASNWQGVTQGQRTMVGVPQVVEIGNSMVCAILAILIAYLYQRSRSGQRLRASREDENAAAVLGVRVSLERLVAFTISAGVVGAGGVLYAHFSSGFSPNHFFLQRTFLIVAMVIVGGRHSLPGVVTGVFVITIVAEVLRKVEEGVVLFGVSINAPTGMGDVALGLFLLAVLVWRPEGIIGPAEIRWPSRNKGAAREVETN
ncbi:MAG: branched-chain amino acid ABC transporter permease [Actinobacteria bacterium]|nr:branched-chain amino acid ABC transporter permease [Actinomycetota bacterium]